MYKCLSFVLMAMTWAWGAHDLPFGYVPSAPIHCLTQTLGDEILQISPMENDLHAYIAWAYDQPPRITNGVGNVRTQALYQQKMFGGSHKVKAPTRRNILTHCMRSDRGVREKHGENLEDPEQTRRKKQILDEIYGWNLDPFADEHCAKNAPLLFRRVNLSNLKSHKIDDVLQLSLPPKDARDNFSDMSYRSLCRSLKYMMKWRIGNCGEYSRAVYLLLAVYPVSIPTLNLEIFNTGHDHGFVIVGRNKNCDVRHIPTWIDHAYCIDPWSRVMGIFSRSNMMRITQTVSPLCSAHPKTTDAYVGMWANWHHDVMDILNRHIPKRGVECIPFSGTLDDDLTYHMMGVVRQIFQDFPKNSGKRFIFPDYLWCFLTQDKQPAPYKIDLLNILLTQEFTFSWLHGRQNQNIWATHTKNLDRLIAGLLNNTCVAAWMKGAHAADVFFHLYNQDLRLSWDLALRMRPDFAAAFQLYEITNYKFLYHDYVGNLVRLNNFYRDHGFKLPEIVYRDYMKMYK